MLDGAQNIPELTYERAYREWLAFYSFQMQFLNWNTEDLVAEANKWHANFGKLEPPKVRYDYLQKLKIKDVPALRVVFKDRRQAREAGRINLQESYIRQDGTMDEFSAYDGPTDALYED